MTDLRAVALVFLSLTAAGAIEFLTLARPGSSPYLAKLSERENTHVKSICGRQTPRDDDSPTFKISGGHSAEVGQFPWAVGVAHPGGQSFCGGSIISPRHFVSAAHCFFAYKEDAIPCGGISPNPQLFNLEIHYGGTCSREAGGTSCDKADTRTTRIRKVMFARHFHDNSCRKGKDLAIVEIEGNFDFDERAKPICLPQPGENIMNTEYSSFTNYGFGTDEYRKKSPLLQYVDFHRRSVFICQPSSPEMDTICVLPDVKTKGICIGDSGSGFQAKRSKDRRTVLLGIHSIGPMCGDGRPYKSTYVTHYLNDICRVAGVCNE